MISKWRKLNRRGLINLKINIYTIKTKALKATMIDDDTLLSVIGRLEKSGKSIILLIKISMLLPDIIEVDFMRLQYILGQEIKKQL